MNRRQTIPPQQKYTTKQFLADFPNDDACLEYMLNKRWPGGVALCVECKAERKHYRVTGRTCYACPVCGNHIFPLAGTIFHKSTTPLTTWFFVIKLMSSTRVGISAKQIQRETGVTYKTAWRMMKQVRKLMADKIKLQGPVEIDEGYFGGIDANKHEHLRGGSKTPVLGIVERGGRVVARVMSDAKRESILPIIGEVLVPNMTVYSDGSYILKNVREMGHTHMPIKHKTHHVRDDRHINTIEGFWSLLKRGIGGVYYQVGKEYLQSYLDEYSFRYNRRKVMVPMFTLLAERTKTQVCPSAYESRRALLPSSSTEAQPW
jgi:transposase-like protein